MNKSVCPKCGGKLRLLDWREECPHCGVNMTYYNREEELLRDADRAEAEFARFQPHVDRAVASFIGAPRTVFRLVCSILPIGALMLPLGSLRYTALLENKEVPFQILAAVRSLLYRQWERDFSSLPSGATVCVLLLLCSVVCILAHLVGILAGCTKKGRIFLFAADAAMFLFAGGSALVFRHTATAVQASLTQYIDRFTLSWGVYVYFALLALCLAADLYVAIRGVPVKYKQRYIADIPAEEYFAMQEKERTPQK